jgi:Putative esterase
MKPWSIALRGQLDEHVFESTVLRGNLPGDPSSRPLWVYLPPACRDQPRLHVPSIYLIQGMTGQVDMWRNRSAFRPNVLELVDELFAGPGPAPPTIIVFVDCWTSYGGSQFIDSPATGKYGTYLADEIVEWVDQHYPTLAEPAHRGIAGKSSGGYGAMINGLLRPDRFGGLATHAGDALFEICYQPEFADVARALRGYDGSYDRWWADFRSRPAFTKPADAMLINTYAMAACYSAEPDGSIQFPFDLVTGELDSETWQRWLAWDPVRVARTEAGRAALAGLRAIYIDAGNRDEYHLDLGAEAFRQACLAAGSVEPFFELFDAGHGAIEYRYPIALRYLAERLSDR